MKHGAFAGINKFRKTVANIIIICEMRRRKCTMMQNPAFEQIPLQDAASGKPPARGSGKPPARLR
jgi:hypothetical protein